MTYFKIISNGEAVDAGWMWLQWNGKHRCLMACEPRDAHYCQNYTETAIYRIGWLNPVPEGAPIYPTAEAAIIDPDEYNDLIEAFDGGETVPEPVEPEPEPEPEPGPEPEPEPEHRMTIAEMREKIAALTALVMNESGPFAARQTYQTGEIIANGARVYIARQVIVQGETVAPGVNCDETTIADVLNTLQAQQ